MICIKTENSFYLFQVHLPARKHHMLLFKLCEVIIFLNLTFLLWEYGRQVYAPACFIFFFLLCDTYQLTSWLCPCLLLRQEHLWHQGLYDNYGAAPNIGGHYRFVFSEMFFTVLCFWLEYLYTDWELRASENAEIRTLPLSEGNGFNVQKNVYPGSASFGCKVHVMLYHCQSLWSRVMYSLSQCFSLCHSFFMLGSVGNEILRELSLVLPCYCPGNAWYCPGKAWYCSGNALVVPCYCPGNTRYCPVLEMKSLESYPWYFFAFCSYLFPPTGVWVWNSAHFNTANQC